MLLLSETFTPIGAIALTLNTLSFFMAIFILARLKVQLERLRSDFHFFLRFITALLLLVNRSSQLLYHFIFFYIQSFGEGSDDYEANVRFIYPLRRLNYALFFAFFSTMYIGFVLIVSLTLNRYER